MLELSAELIMHFDYCKEKSVIRLFCGILGYNVGIGQWKRPSTYTPILAGLQFCIRVLMLEKALPQGTRDRFPDMFRADPLTTFKRIRDNWLVEGEPSPFNYIHKLLNYGMNSAKDAGGRDRVRWSADRRTMYFDGRALEIKRWKKFVRDLLEDTEELLNQKLLFRQGKHIETVDLHQYIDDPNLSDAGH